MKLLKTDTENVRRSGDSLVVSLTKYFDVAEIKDKDIVRIDVVDKDKKKIIKIYKEI